MKRKGTGAENKSNALRDTLILSALTILLLIPFANKAFHIDDPLFLWAAAQIQKNPVDFYGFTVNWYGYVMPMSEVMKNPPLTSYFIALVASITGWGEAPIHISFILPAIALVTGTYFLARRFCADPLLAALATLITPVFLVSATSVMSDVMMLAFWAWAMVLWIRGTERDELSSLFLSGLFIAMSALTKYFGMSLVPLLCAYSILNRKNPARWVPAMLIPVVILAGYQWLTHGMYGRGLLFDAASYAVGRKITMAASLAESGFIGLVFAGGCMITALFYKPLLWSRRALLGYLIMAVVVGVVLLSAGKSAGMRLVTQEGTRWELLVQLMIFGVVGLGIIALSIRDVIRRKDPFSAVLFLWIAGTFVFASFVNWTTNGRTVLPMAPAMGILISRAMEERGVTARGASRALRTYLPLVPAVFISLMVAWGDLSLANSNRTMAEQISEKYRPRPPLARKLWFEGHWGFQWYMEDKGAAAINFDSERLSTGDVVAVPLSNTNIRPLPVGRFREVEEISFPTYRWASVMSPKSGAGFYSSAFGPLPFVILPAVYRDTYIVAEITGEIRFYQMMTF